MTLLRCTAAALALLGACAPAAEAASADVAALQVALRARGLYAGSVDGIAGPGTLGGVRRLQARRRLVVDGVAGPLTRRALGWRGRPGLGARAVAEGRRGWDVAALQFLLGRAGFPSGGMDGDLGPRTGAALRRFQAWAALAPDGIAGPATLAALRQPPPRSPLRFAAPTWAPVGDRFGPRADWFHAGVDYRAPAGSPVGAAGRGCVTNVTYDAGYGNLVVIGHRLGMTSWYAHLDTVAVRAGQCVTAGARIGTVGSTGRSTGPHLHFELRLRGAAIDPVPATSALLA